jgi:hypothetical protein
MNISKSDLYRIVLEEYIKEENLDETMSREKVDALLRQIRGGPWEPSDDETKFIRTYRNAAADSPTSPVRKAAADSPTSPMEKPLKPESVENKVMDLVKNMNKADVATLFDAIYKKIKENPGPVPDYGGLAEDKPNNSAMAWDELKDIIREVLAESV